MNPLGLKMLKVARKIPNKIETESNKKKNTKNIQDL